MKTLIRICLVVLVATNASEKIVAAPQVILNQRDVNAPTTTPAVAPTHPMDNPDWLPPDGPMAEKTKHFWYNLGQNVLENQLRKNHLNRNVAKNVIIFLGDGMSIPTLAATRVLMGGEEKVLSFEKFPYIGLAKTYCINYQVADSTCTATAILTGVKNNYGVASLSGNVPLNNCTAAQDKSSKLDSILKWAQMAGRSTGVVTTTRITHATPSAAYANSGDREWEDDSKTPTGCDDVAVQLVQGEIGKKLNVALGGGARGFYPNTYTDANGNTGRRRDGRFLINEWLEMKKNVGKATFISNRNDLLKLNASNTDYLLGLFTFDHMEYHLRSDAMVQPTLKEMTEKAIEVLENNVQGYVLFVEGGRIDQAHHETMAHLALDETIEFHKAVEYARSHTREDDTLIVVTADHSHTMTMGGYPVRKNSILGPGDFSRFDEMPFFTLSYANGPSYDDHFHKTGGRKNPLDMNFEDINFRYPATVPYEDETHGGDDVAVFASGPWAHIFTGLYEQNFIAHGIYYASCLGPEQFSKSDECRAYGTGTIRQPPYLLLAVFALYFVKYSLVSN